jgi:hypothetical protein
VISSEVMGDSHSPYWRSSGEAMAATELLLAWRVAAGAAVRRRRAAGASGEKVGARSPALLSCAPDRGQRARGRLGVRKWAARALVQRDTPAASPIIQASGWVLAGASW